MSSNYSFYIRFRSVLGRSGAFSVLPFAAIALLCWQIPPAAAGDLNQQLTIPLNNGTHSPARDSADRLMGLGKAQQMEGDLTGAIASWRQAIRLYQQIGDMDAQGVVYGALASAYDQLDQPRAREDSLRRRLAVARDQRDFTGQIAGLNNLGRTLAARPSGTPGAGELLTEGMEVAASVRSQTGERLTAINMEWLANSLDEPDQHTRRYEVAFLPPSQWYANPISFGSKLSDRGTVRLAEQRYYMATRLNQVATDLAAMGSDANLQLQIMDHQVMALRAMGRYDLARNVLGDRLLVVRKLNDPREELATLATLGEINQEIGRITLAQIYYEQALVVAERLNDPQQAGVLKERLASFEVEEK